MSNDPHTPLEYVLMHRYAYEERTGVKPAVMMLPAETFRELALYFAERGCYMSESGPAIEPDPSVVNLEGQPDEKMWTIVWDNVKYCFWGVL